MKSTSRMTKALLGGVILLLVFALVGQAAAQTWTQLSPSGGPPGVRVSHSAVFNSTNNRMIVFGGLNADGVGSGGPLFNDVWVLTNADGIGGPSTWTQLTPTGGPPSARAAHSAVYDAVNNRMTVFAGDPNIGSCGGAVNDVWVLTNADGTGGTPTWTQLLSPTAGPPHLRQGPRAVYDAATNRMIAFGGNTNACGAITNDVWVLQNANGSGGPPTWTQLFPTGVPPAANGGPTAVYDATNNRLIVYVHKDFGGIIGVVNEVSVLENANGLGGMPHWTQLSPTGEPSFYRVLHSAVYDSANNRMMVFGGYGPGASSGGRRNDVWVLANANGLGGTPNWAQLSPTGVLPSSRDAHTAVYNPATNRMVVFAGRSCSGGCTGPEFFALNDVWVLTDANGIISVPYTITASAGPNGSIAPSGAVTVNSGGSQIFTIAPSVGYHIAGVLVDGVPVGLSSYTFTGVIADHTISATFAIDTYTITASAGPNGSIAPSGAVTVNSGDSQTFTITPNAGFHVADVLVDGISVGAVTSYPFSVVTANHTIAASFAADTPVPSSAPFAAFAAKVEIELGPLANDDEFEVKATFTLGAGSNGIDPLTEDVSFQVGTFSTTIPAGSFHFKPAKPGKHGKPGKPAEFTFEGVIGGVSLEAKITPLGANAFEFKVEGKGTDLTGTVNPVTLSLTIGNDGGSTTVTAKFE